MPQDIQLQQVMVDGMVVKMRGHDIRRHIISRMLHRSKGIDLLAKRQYDDTARMLPGTPPDPRTSKHDPVDLALTLPLPPLGKIILHIAERRLIRQRSNGSRAICLTGSKDNLCILMRKALIITGEIQVDIRLLIPLESQECLKGDIKPILLKRLAAFRTRLIRHIPSAPSGIGAYLFGIKITVMTMLTIIVGT